MYTSSCYLSGTLFNYIFHEIVNAFDDVHIVSVELTGKRSFKSRLKKFQKLGVLSSLEVLSGMPFDRYFRKKDRQLFDEMIPWRELPQPLANYHTTHGVNSDTSAALLRSLKPDFIIQSGAGILREKIFSVAKNATLNVHHGIAPRLRGMNSSYWAKWEKKKDCLGATVHFIDKGIDTGKPVFYADSSMYFDEPVGKIDARSTISAVQGLIDYIRCVEANEPYAFPEPTEFGDYRSTISGWKILLSR